MKAIPGVVMHAVLRRKRADYPEAAKPWSGDDRDWLPGETVDGAIAEEELPMWLTAVREFTPMVDSFGPVYVWEFTLERE